MHNLTSTVTITAQAATEPTNARRIERGTEGWPAILEEIDVSAGSEGSAASAVWAGSALPGSLWVRGSVAALASERPKVAILGARACTSYGEHMAARLGSELAEAGVDVVGGTSYGIESAALRGVLAVDAPDAGRPVAIIPCGIERAYPAASFNLIEAVEQCGAVVSAYAPGLAPARARFIERTTLIVSLASAVVIVEAAAKSSSRRAAAMAEQLGRPVLAVPGSVTSIQSSGCHELIRQGIAQLCTDSDDILEAL